MCEPAEEAAFPPAYRDALRLLEAAQAVSSAVRSRIEGREDKLDARHSELPGDGLTDDQRRPIRDWIK